MRARRERDVVAWVKRHRATIFSCLTFLVFMQAGFILGRNHDPWVSGPRHHQHHAPHPSSNLQYAILKLQADAAAFASHPISRHMRQAEQLYAAKISSQSTTLAAAVKEYKRRYKRAPPAGFDKWWAFAQEHGVKMVDEYDALAEDLAPFWEISGEEVRRRALQVGELPFINIVRIRKGKSSVFDAHPDALDTEVSARAIGFQSMLEKFAHLLPDMDFPINSLSEGRVLVPWEHRKFPNLTQENSSVGLERVLGGPFRADWGDDGNVWDAWRRTCPPSSEARRILSSKRTGVSVQDGKNYFDPYRTKPGDDFRFLSAQYQPASWPDFCRDPDAHNVQGHFFSDWRTIHGLYPVFSPAKAQGYLDIKIPSHYYFGSTKRYTYGWNAINLEMEEGERMEVPWEGKERRVFWRGATTGGGNHPPGNSPQYQRHRFVHMASDESDTNRTITFPQPTTGRSDLVSASVPISRLNSEIMDIAFVKAVAAEVYPGGTEALVAAHRFGDPATLGDHWKYKYLLDLDGMGYSGRFMAFLASDSVPVKATVYEEFFRDWMQPWVHYIPLSPSFNEIYNIHAYFSGPTLGTGDVHGGGAGGAAAPQSDVGDKQLKRIARAGKQWKKTVGRPIDMEAYVYRLCLEWARLWADDRDAMGFSL